VSYESALKRWAEAKADFHRRLVPSKRDGKGRISTPIAKELVKAEVALHEWEDTFLFNLSKGEVPDESVFISEKDIGKALIVFQEKRLAAMSACCEGMIDA